MSTDRVVNAKCSIAIDDVDVNPAKRHTRTTIGIRVVQLRTASRDLAKSGELQRIRQRIFEPPASHEWLNVAGDHYIHELMTAD